MKVFPFDLKAGEYFSLMENLQVSNKGISIMKGRFSLKTFMIKDISTPAANVIKQHVLSMGGEAAVPFYSVNCSQPKSDLVFSIREDKLPSLIDKFKSQCWKLPEVAVFIEKFATLTSPWFMFEYEKINTSRPAIMGILNVTPDSFSDGGKYFSIEKAVERAAEMISEGADIIDVGGVSTRHGATNIEEKEELSRVVPVIKEILNRFPEVVISIDTTKSSVAQKALDAGACIINDISGMTFDENMVSVCAERNVPVIIMHIKGTPENMQNEPFYNDLFTEMLDFFDKSIEKALSKGVSENKIIIDPGIGFGKNLNHNISIIKHFEIFHSLFKPVLAGISRKSMIGKITGRNIPFERIAGTVALNMQVLEQGAAILRVHDVKEAKDTVAIYSAIKESKCF